MLTLSSLFGTSPFSPLVRHMESIKPCIDELHSLMLAFIDSNTEQLNRCFVTISTFKHTADILRNDIRNALSRALFLSGNKSTILAILKAQDDIVAAVEDVAVLMTVRTLPFLQDLQHDFILFVERNIASYTAVYEIVLELPGLTEASFSGVEAEKVKLMADRVSTLEHEADIIQRNLLRGLFHNDTTLSPGMFHQWNKIFESIGSIANASERLALAICMTVDTSAY